MCETCTAGVASCSSEVVTLPVFRPRFLASSSRVGWALPRMSTETALSYVLVPVAHAEPVAAESGT